MFQVLPSNLTGASRLTMKASRSTTKAGFLEEGMEHRASRMDQRAIFSFRHQHPSPQPPPPMEDDGRGGAQIEDSPIHYSERSRGHRSQHSRLRNTIQQAHSKGDGLCRKRDRRG